MTARESAAEPAPAADRREERSDERPLSMRDLLAACAAADAVSTPPKAPEPEQDRNRPAA
ncbi:hypothetical protein AB0H73_20600 [Streptomyces olivoreticuli]|uniref:hypothetical protein n=1 Tax=Streptomyces olivoreticuli TaxID=68246 RepID=UPI000E254DC9|nr:hypothetical protein [Streptomyces olivoreticuli]